MATNTQVKQHVLARPGAEKAIIRSTGEVDVYGVMPNTSTRGWYFAGWKSDIEANMQAENAISDKQRIGNRPGQGRQAKIAPGERAVIIRAMVSPAQRARFLALGGSAWLRSALDAYQAASSPDTASAE